MAREPQPTASPSASLLRRALAGLGLTAVLALAALPALATRAQDPAPAGAKPANDPAGKKAEPQTEQEYIEALKKGGDAVSPEYVRNLAHFKTRTAMQALLELFNSFGTVFMKREVVRALPAFDGVTDAEQPAMQKLMDVATQSKEIELRSAAVDALGECNNQGKVFLRLIVESAADDLLRERAMQAHLKLHDKSDLDWYRELYKPKRDDDADSKKGGKKDSKKDAKKPEKKEPKKGGKDAKDDKDKEGDDKPDDPASRKGRILPNVRLVAFEALVSNMTPEELYEATLDRAWKIRDEALGELDRRQDPKVGEIADKTLSKGVLLDSTHGDPRSLEVTPVRCRAARIVGRVQGLKAVDDLIKKGGQMETPRELRLTLAEIVAGFNDDKTNKQLVQALTGRASAQEKLFLIAATKKLPDDKVGKGLEHLLSDKEADVVVAACRALTERQDKGAVDKLSKMIGKGKDRNTMRAALEALVVLRKGDPAWVDELVALSAHEDSEVRNLALEALGQTKDQKAIAKLVEALNDPSWSVRLAALDALAHMRSKDAISPIVERMAKEEGRMLSEFSLALWRLTGQGYGENAGGWKNWWAANGASFELLTEAQLNSVKTGEEEYRLRQTTRVESKFFGLRIISHRVIFIIDVSGSMQEVLNSEYDGKSGTPRIEVARRELERCIGGLDPAAFFNILTFSTDVDRWTDGALAAANEKNREEAKLYASKLKEGGGTNIYGAMQEAFKDPDVDTIFFLSDGEPSQGDEIDPMVIREHVKAWNEHRGIQINTISIGGQFQLLEWFAEDSGGTNIRFD